jgi:hypothetical protein
METVRLRKIQQPSQVERLLDLLISRGSYLPNDCTWTPPLVQAFDS